MNIFFAKGALALSALMLFSCASTPKESVSAEAARWATIQAAPRSALTKFCFREDKRAD